jgi:tape measure domain-containing protein
MSSSIDQRIVEMQFDNAQFEKGISTSLKSIDNLEKGLKLDGASKGLESVSKAANSMDFSGLQGGIYAVQQKFSALEVIGITALQRITNAAISTGESLVKSLSIDQISAGFAKFGSKTSSVATLVAQGNELERVNEQLDRLNWFTDETSYSFTDMVANIAKFTASGKGLDESVTAMEGIANWAALSGQNATTASRAMYQLSQAMGAGIMRKEDYKSIQNASMDTDEFRQKCLDAGVALGKLKKNADDTYTSLVNNKGSFTKSQFAEHLTDDAWFTSDVMMSVFQTYSSAVDQIYDYADEKGITASQAISELGDKVDSFGLKAFKAAQEARTWGDAVDSVKDAVSTGWMNTFELIFGNQEEATQLWTDLANAMYDVFAGGAEARNEMLKEWKESGGRDDLIQSFWNIWDAVSKVTASIKEAFGEIFAPMTSGKLLSMTENLKNFTESLIVSDETANKLKRTFKGVFAVFDIFKKVLGTVGDAIAKLLGSDGLKDLGNTLLDSAASLGDFLVSLNESFSTDGITGMFDKIVTVISDLFSGVLNSAGGFSGAFGTIGSSISSVLGFIWNSFKTVFSWLKENISLKGILGTVAAAFSALTGKELFDAASGISGFIEKLTGAGKNSGSLKAKISELFESLHDSLQALTTSIKVTSLVGIAGAIGVLTASLNTLSQIDAGAALKGISTMAAMFKMLTKSLDSITKTLSKNGSKGLGKASISLILIAESMKVLASAMAKFGGLSLKEIAKGLIGVGGGLTILCVGLKALNGVKVPLRTSISLLAIAESCKILGDAMSKFSGFSWDEIGRSLTAMGGALGELVVALGILNKVSGLGSLAGSVSTLIIVQSLSGLADGLSKFGSFSWDEIEHGLVGMGGALAEVSTAIVAVSKLAGFGSLFAAGSIAIVISGLDELADSLTKFGFMSWEAITHGLVAMGGALAEVAGFTGALGNIAGFSGLLGAGSIRLTITGLSDLADALEQIGGLSWDEIKRGLSGMGGALLEVSAITGAHGLISGFSGLLGSGSLLLAIQGLNDLAEAFKTFSTMSWEDVNNALTAMLGAMGATALGGLANTFSGLGAASIKAVADGLGPLAEAVKQWQGVSVDDNLPGQLSSLATGVSSFWAAGWGADAINTVSSGLGTLAESVNAWQNVEVPDNIADNMLDLANAISTFTFSGFGSSAISTVAAPLGELAASVNAWNGVTIKDDLGTQLSNLATGVSSFWAAGWGADAINTVSSGLGTLAESVGKWESVSIDDMLGTKLTSLATGVEAFSFAFLAGWSIDQLVNPLASLADSVLKWKSVSIPAKIGEKLKDLASGINDFGLSFLAGWSLGTVTGPLGDLADSINKWNSVTIPDDISTKLSGLADGLMKFSGVGNISLAISSIETISEAAVKLSGANFDSISSGLASLTDALTKLGSIDLSAATNMGDITGAVASMIQTLSTAIQNSAPTISESFGSMLTTVINNSVTYQNLFYTNGQTLMTKIVDGFNSGNGTLSASVVNVLTSGAAAIYDQYQNWYTAGAFLDIGLAAGIRSGESNVITAATDVATKAIKAAKDALQINSPSKVTYGFGRFFDLGLSNGIYDYADRVAKATETISNQALSAAQIIAENIAATMDEDFEYEPTIRPVLDMDEVDSGLNAFDRSFANRSMNLAGSIDRVRKAAPVDKYAENVNPSQNQNGGSNTYNFNQYNYSPKALSRIDLYRQTNNQFAMMKERGKA